MKISILGYSGAGKSTLARTLGGLYGLDVLHLDSVHFLPGWVVRENEEKQRIVKAFLDTHDSWVIDGNYSKLSYDRRMESADLIVLLLFNRITCLFRAYRRYKSFKGTTRPDMGKGCNEKFDKEFVKWILWEGRSKAARARYKDIISKHREKTVVIRNQRQLDRFIKASEKQLSR
ncbi:MAG: DNA topology modulation protein [Clostridia bacterium]|nr:DNA topology modulation protein [Clostridia bacterium]